MIYFWIYRATGEMHLVHKNSKYTTMDEALNHADGLAVLGFFLGSSFSKRPFAVIKQIFLVLNLDAFAGLPCNDCTQNDRSGPACQTWNMLMFVLPGPFHFTYYNYLVVIS